METTQWVYRNPDLGISVEKISTYLQLKEENGSFDNGTVNIHSANLYDENWGSDAKIDITWETIDRATYHQGKRVRNSIKMYNAINVSVTKKETEWVRSHELTYWYGMRKQLKSRRHYASTIIHGVMLCEQTNRVFEIHIEVISSLLANYETFLLNAMKSLVCHG